MGKKYDFDYIIIGSGPAGSTAALSLSKSKKKIAIVEGGNFGGSNLNTRDIPYAISLNFSHLYSRFSSCPEINGRELHYNFPTVVAHQNYITSTMGNQIKEDITSSGVTIIDGFAHFIDAHTIAVNDKQYTSDNFIIATGAKNSTKGILGTDQVKCLTPDTIIKARRLPKFILVVGGGSTGCEVAEYFAELGVKEVILEKESRLLPREDHEAGEALSEYLTRRLGVVVLTNANVVAIQQDQTSKIVIFKIDNQEKNIRIDHIVLATGSEPNTDLGLENAQVKFSPHGIEVNRFFQTTAKNVYAIGDCIGGESSTEKAEYQASLLAANLINKAKNVINYNGFIRVTNTYPEIASVGVNEAELSSKKHKYNAGIVYLKDLPISKIHNLDYGFVKIITEHSGRVIGATIVSPNAGAMAEEISIVIRHNLNIIELASTPHIANSFSSAIRLTAKKLIK